MEQKYIFLQRHVPIDIDNLNATASLKINETRNSIVRCHRTVILSRILFEEDKSIYGDYIPDASKLPSFVYNPKEIVPPKVSPQLLQQTSYLFSFLHKNLDKLFEGMMRLLDKKDIQSINESNFKNINSPTFHFLINSAIPSLFGYFSSKEYISLAFSFYSHVIGLNSPYLTFQIIYPFFTSPWIFRYFESSLIPLFKSFSRDSRVQQYFTNDEQLKKKMRNKSNDFTYLSNIYANTLIDSFISNSLLLPQFFIVIIKMLGEKWNNQIIGNFLANELFKDMSFKYLENFGYGDYKEFLINVFISISNNIDLQIKLSKSFCQINTSSFSSLEIPEMFLNFDHHYINFLCSVPEIMALEKAITMRTELPSSITGFSYDSTPKFYLFFIKVFPKRYMPELQKERNLIFNVVTDEIPNEPDFERKFLQIESAIANQQQELIHALQNRHESCQSSNSNIRNDSNENEKETINKNSNENDTINSNKNEVICLNSNESKEINSNSNENNKINSNSNDTIALNSDSICINDLQNSIFTVYDFARAFHLDDSFTHYSLSRCTSDLNEEASAFESFMLTKFNLTEIQNWLDISLEQERVVMMPVAEIAVNQAFMRGYETVKVAFQHASSLFKRSTIIMKDQYLRLVTKYIVKLMRAANNRWKSDKTIQGPSGLKNWWLSKRRGRHLSFEDTRDKETPVLYQFSSESNDNICGSDTSQSSSASLNSKRTQNAKNESNCIQKVNDNILGIQKVDAGESKGEINDNGESGCNQNIALKNDSSHSDHLSLESSEKSIDSSADYNSSSNQQNSPLSSPNLNRLSSTPPVQKSSFRTSFRSPQRTSFIGFSSSSIADDFDLLEEEWQSYISFLSLEFGRVDTGINNKFAGSIFFESVESFRNVSMKNLSASFRNLTSGISFLIRLFESGMSKMDLIQMAIALSDNKELIRFYLVINAFAMSDVSFHRLCNEDEILAWVKFESALLKMISAKKGSQLERIFFRIQDKLLD